LKYPDFAQCYTAAANELESLGEGQLCYGLYTPLSDKNKWDERWISNRAKSFLHWWVETDEHIIDTGSQQFGEERYKIVPRSDIRYVKVGNEINGAKVPVERSNIKIKWNTLISESSIEVTWPQYEDYLSKVGVL